MPPKASTLVLEFALARCVFAVIPDHPLAVLSDVGGHQGNNVLAVIVEGDFADDGVGVLRFIQLGQTFLRLGPTFSMASMINPMAV